MTMTPGTMIPLDDDDNKARPALSVNAQGVFEQTDNISAESVILKANLNIQGATLTGPMIDTLERLHRGSQELYPRKLRELCNILEKVDTLVKKPYELPHDLITDHKELQEIMKDSTETITALQGKLTTLELIRDTIHGYRYSVSATLEKRGFENDLGPEPAIKGNVVDETLQHTERILTTIENMFTEVLG